MPVVGYKKDTGGVTLGIYYNDLYVTASSRFLSVASDIKTWAACTGGSTTQPYDYCIPDAPVYAIALTGLKSPSDARMKLTIPRVDEPDWGEEDNLDEDPVDIPIGASFAEL